jgi:hypothetical protein
MQTITVVAGFGFCAHLSDRDWIGSFSPRVAFIVESRVDRWSALDVLSFPAKCSPYVHWSPVSELAAPMIRRAMRPASIFK